MLLNTCPFTKYGNDVSSTSRLGIENVTALHVTKQDDIDEHTAPLSVKFVLRGREHYHLEKRELSVDPDTYAIFNKGQDYGSRINSQDNTFSFCVFFSDQFVSDGIRTLTKPHTYLLENVGEKKGELNFYQRLYRRNASLDRLIHSVNPLTGDTTIDALRMEEWYEQLFALLYSEQVDQSARGLSIKVKSSTRQELLRRMGMAIDFMIGHLDKKISLASLAEVACLSPFYFLKTFREVFHETPYRYLSRTRIEYACRLLIKTSMPVNEISIACGFEDDSSFIRAFRSQIGYTPMEYRVRTSKI